MTFDMRDARAREWDTWTADSLYEVVMPDGSVVVEWTEVTDETTEHRQFLHSLRVLRRLALAEHSNLALSK